jgi:hypothetical protein
MSGLLQAHERLARLLLRNSDHAIIDLPDRMVLQSSLVDLSSSAAMGSSCSYLTDEIKEVFERLAEHLSWLSLCSESRHERTVILLQANRLYLNKYFHAERDIETSFKALVEQK